MQQRKAVMDIANMVRASSMSNHRCQDLVKRAEKVANDSEKDSRLNAQLCKACHYFDRIGGQAFTMRPCMSCGSEEQYGSTATDVLCMPCAKDGDLCKRCGGDLEMRAKRRIWPQPKADF